MAGDQIHGEWVATAVHYDGVNLWPEQRHGYACRGLLIVPAYDNGFWPNLWAIWHQASGLDLIEVSASLDRTMEIAGHLANVVDWRALAEPDWVENDLLRMKLQAFATGYPDELGDRNDGLSVPSEMDRIVPYGDWRSGGTHPAT